MTTIIKNIKGTKDVLLSETLIWQFIESQVHSFFKKYGFHEIKTPAFENTNLFIRSIGKETDMVSKEMYSWTDQGGNKLTLKPEATASVVRAYIQHSLGKKTPLNKLYYIDSLFRRERPQKGRYRQFKQFGIEVIGSPFPEQDAEVIALAYNFLDFLGVKELTLKVNSIGSQETRNNYKKKLYDYLLPHKNTLTKVSQNRLMINPLRILDTKIDFEIEIINNAPHILDYLNNDDNKHFNQILKFLDNLNIKYIIDHSLVRGLDYYSRTVFEIQSSQLGAQMALCGGGRYDYLIEELGGKATPAIGFATGIERLILALNINEDTLISRPDVYIAPMDENALEHSLNIAELLRINKEFVVITDTLRRSLKAQMKEANRLNVQYTIIIGDHELKNNQVVIKNMDSGDQKNIPFDKIESFFNK